MSSSWSSISMMPLTFNILINRSLRSTILIFYWMMMSNRFCNWTIVLLISLITGTMTSLIFHHLVDDDSKCARVSVYLTILVSVRCRTYACCRSEPTDSSSLGTFHHSYPWWASLGNAGARTTCRRPQSTAHLEAGQSHSWWQCQFNAACTRCATLGTQ